MFVNKLENFDIEYDEVWTCYLKMKCNIDTEEFIHVGRIHSYNNVEPPSEYDSIE